MKNYSICLLYDEIGITVFVSFKRNLFPFMRKYKYIGLPCIKWFES